MDSHFRLTSDPPSVMPRTRFQGSKRKLAGWILEQVSRLGYESVLDAFGGTGSVAYAFKQQGKTVTYSDKLHFNHLIGTALIENNEVRLSDEQVQRVATASPKRSDNNLVERSFEGIYFTSAENRWIDAAVQEIGRMEDRFSRSLAYYALFQSAMIKRPYNLFHRKNLYMREADVPRSFGNKVTWDRPFAEHFRKIATEVNAAVFDNGKSCRAVCGDAMEVSGDAMGATGAMGGFDLVYIDTPYIGANKVGVDYLGFYHFLEGLADYDRWEERIDFETKHRRMLRVPNPWVSADSVGDAFGRLFERYEASILVVSYRSDGIPTIEELEQMMRRVKRNVTIVSYDTYQYALSKNRQSKEMLLVGT